MNHRAAGQPENSAENSESKNSNHRGAQKPFVSPVKVDAVKLLHRGQNLGQQLQ